MVTGSQLGRLGISHRMGLSWESKGLWLGEDREADPSWQNNFWGRSMAINRRNFRELIVRPALQQMQMWSPEAEELLMLTAAQESRLGEYLRQGVGTLDDGKGAALGPFGMEEQTFHWLRDKFPDTAMLGGRLAQEMVWDLVLAAKAARLRYRVVQDPLPPASDVRGLAAYYKQWYNTPVGAATVEEAIVNYEDLVKR